jgi:hypothetical protein
MGVFNMKTRIFTLIFGLILILINVCFAEENQATNDLLSIYTDMRYSTEAGITKLEYFKQYRLLYSATQKAKDNIPADIYSKFLDTMRTYEDAKIIWNSYGQVFRLDELNSKLNNQYPNIKQKIRPDIFGQYEKDDIISFLFGEANTKEKELEKIIKESK